MRCLMLGLLWSASALAGPRVAVVQSDDLDVYTAPVPAFLEELGEPAMVVNLHGRRAEAEAAIVRLRREDPDAIFALGAKAAWTLARELPDTPVIYASILEPGRYGVSGNQVTGIDATVDPGLFLSQFSGFFPDVDQVAVIRGPGSGTERQARAQEAADAVGITLTIVQAASPREVRRSLGQLPEEVQALWLQPDREILDAGTFRYLTSESRRRGLLLLVETENMVSAGALFAVVPDSAGVGRQAAALVKRVLDGAAPAILPVEAPERTQVILSTRAAALAEVDIDPLLLDFVDVVVE